jgi:hypothetical protein
MLLSLVFLNREFCIVIAVIYDADLENISIPVKMPQPLLYRKWWMKAGR